MPIRPSPLSTAIQLALALGLSHSVQAQPFPAEIEVSELDGTNGFVLFGLTFNGDVGSSVSSAGDVNGDGLNDFMVGEPGAYNPFPDTGNGHIVFGSNQSFPATINLTFPSLSGIESFRLRGEALNDRVGQVVSGAGDINGDGFDDVVISAPLKDANEIDRSGQSYVIFGSEVFSQDSIVIADIDGTNGFVINGDNVRGESGRSLSAAGDLNGDGFDDLLIGARGSVGNDIPGAAYVLFGSDGEFATPFELLNINGINGFELIPEGVDSFGNSVSSAGDINGDGLVDLVVGAYRANPDPFGTGRSYVVFGSDQPYPNPFPVASLNGSNGFAIDGLTSSSSGFAVSNAGDFNADGIDDLMIGAPIADPNNINAAGSTYVIFGSTSGFSTPLDLSTINGINGIVINGEAPLDNSGISISRAGDINGDGIDDLIIGAPTNTGAGRTYIVFGSDGPLPSPLQLATLNGSNGFAISGAQEGDRFGSEVSNAGDINGDGIDDLIIGARTAISSYSGSYYAERNGLAYVVFGRPSIDLAISKTNSQDFVDPEGSVTYVIDVSNPGPVDVVGAILSDILPSTLNSANATWSCNVAVGTVCPNASGTGNLNETVDLPEGSSLSYSITADVVAEEGELIINTATINLPGELVDADPADNSATDSDPTGLFADSFEQEA